MNILIRLDISKDVGTGHFRRMYNLSKYMINFNFIFMIKTDDESNSVFNGIEVIFITSLDEFDNVKEITLDRNIDIIFLDLLHYKNNYIKKIKKLTDTKIVSFHEYDDISEYSDLAINYNFFNGFKEISNPKILAGPKYIIFSEEISSVKSKANKNYIFVSFGGSDPSNLLENFVNNIASQLLEINFVLHIGNFKKFNKTLVSKNIQVLERPQNIFEYMANATLAVTAAGNMMYELMYFNKPMIVIAHNEHQNEFANNAKECDCVNYFGLENTIDYTELKKQIEIKFINRKDCTSTIDSLGKSRILEAIDRLIL